MCIFHSWMISSRKLSSVVVFVVYPHLLNTLQTDLYLGRPLLRSFSTMSESKKNDKGREENKKSDNNDIPITFH